MARAIARATRPSLNSSSSKARVKVCTAPRPARFARFATADESIPPERNTPRGTSETRCSRTLSSSTAESSSSVATGPVPGSGNDQYGPERRSVPSSRYTASSPGSSDSTPSTAVRGPTTKPFQATEAAAQRSSRGVPRSPEARSARTSEAKATDQLPSGSGLRAT